MTVPTQLFQKFDEEELTSKEEDADGIGCQDPLSGDLSRDKEAANYIRPMHQKSTHPEISGSYDTGLCRREDDVGVIYLHRRSPGPTLQVTHCSVLFLDTKSKQNMAKDSQKDMSTSSTGKRMPRGRSEQNE
jgi:hypothetical protein